MLPDGMSYRALTLPQDGQMTPQLLAKIRDMVRAGATVVGPKPTHSPTLQGFPTADADFATMANEIWGDCDGKLVKEHAYGQGRVVWGRPLGDVLGESNIRQDFVYTVGDASTPLLFAHRHLDEADVYFVCNQREQATNAQCSFRVAGKTPEFWRPDTGEVERPAVYSEQNGIITLPVHFEPMGSVFVVFRASNTAADARVVSLTPGSEILFPTTKPAAFTDVFRNFTMEIWANPRMPIVLPAEAASGIIQEGRNDAIFPVPGHELFGWGHAGCGMSVGTNGVVVLEHSAGYLAPVLVQELPIMGWTHLVLVYEEGTPTLYVNGKRTRQGLHGPKIVHPGDLRRPFNGDRRGFAVVGRSLTGSEVAALPDSLPPPPASEMQPPIQLSRGGKGSLIALVTGAASGDYVATTADGALHRFHVDSLPRPMDVAGPWQVTFPANWGAPPHVTFDRLISWPDSADAGVRYFSGTAAYHNTIDIPAGLIRPGQRLMLDLGDVMNMARLFVNGKDLGVLWKRLFQADITGAVHAGANNIRIDITNLWQNRMVGDEQLPVDIPRAAGGQLGVSTWPNWFLDGKPSPTGRFTFCTYAPFTKNTPLQKAGLLGPVTLRVIRLIGVQ